MTRWVRSGSSQKHKKMPGNATKWGEFDNQYARQILPKKKNIESQIDLKQALKSSSSDYPSNLAKMSLAKDFFDEDKYCLSENISNEQQKCTFDESHFDINSSSINNEVDSNSLTGTCKPKIKKNKKKKNFDIEFSSLSETTNKIDQSEVPIRQKKIKLENDSSILVQNSKVSEQDNNNCDFSKNEMHNEKEFSQQHDRKKKKKKNYSKVDSESLSVNDETMETSFSNHSFCDNSNKSLNMEKVVDYAESLDKTSEPDISQDIDKPSKKQKMKKYSKMSNDSNQSSVNNESCKNSSSKVFENKKEKYLKRLQNKREKLGLLLLPRNVEVKLHKIKKRLIEKGFPPEKQKEILRQARRREELKHRKIFNPSKLCFGCREPGHVLADCPKKSGSLNQETGICFKCGSVEHTSYKCPEDIQGYPYAKCFICKEQGHISRDCPKNKQGVYPKGGRCKLCGNVNHLKKDCPTLKKNENEEETITLHTLSENASIDAEEVEKEKIEKKLGKKAKVVKF